jgi:S-(hydroxymethyl)glutathione dehydrogenase/alcohol dehydrogenase
MAGASKIIAVDINPAKFPAAIKMGATDCVDSSSLQNGVSVQKHIAGVLTEWGVDYSFDCTGHTEVMRAALECAHRGWGTSCVIGVAASGQEIATRPFQLVTGRGKLHVQKSGSQSIRIVIMAFSSILTRVQA